MSEKRIVALCGNQNCGKSTLFNRLTGAGAQIGNYPGITVEASYAPSVMDGSVEFVDLPGVYSLDSAFTPEEQVTSDFISSGKADLIINVVDATALHRNLYLTLQLLERKLPMLVALNFCDEAEKRKIRIDSVGLSKALGVPVYFVSGRTGQGVEMLAYRAESQKTAPEADFSPTDSESRYRNIERLISKYLRFGASAEDTRTDRIDRVLLGKYTAFPCFAVLLISVFWLIFSVGSILSGQMSYLCSFFGEKFSLLLTAAGVSDMLRSIVVDGGFAGVSAVLSFLPTAVLLYLSLSVLEDSGYMARAAFLTDYWMGKFGTSGSCFVPLSLGFGCTTPAILATRVLRRERDRKITALMVPFVPCGARLTVLAMFASLFFSPLVTALLAALPIVIAFGYAMFFKTCFPENTSTPFLLEMPPYRTPSVSTVFKQTGSRTMEFIKRACTVILISSILMKLLGSLRLDFSWTSSPQESLIAAAGRFMEPIFRPIGAGDWRVIVSLFAGLNAKESVLSTLSALTGRAVGDAVELLFSPLSACTFCVFVLLYSPCISAVAALKKEIGLRGALLAAIIQTVIAWLAAAIIYRIGLLLI